MKAAIVGAGVALFALLGVSCSSQSSPSMAAVAFPTMPLAVVNGDGAKVHVEVRTSPDQPPVAGLEDVELVVTDTTTGAPLDGLTITLTPWMPAMGHGSSTVPTLTPMGQGHYVFHQVSLFMPGEWQLRTKFSGAIVDTIEPAFSIP